MNHILKNHRLTHLQLMVKLPTTHIITTQTRITTKPINMLRMRSSLHNIRRKSHSTTHRRLIRHFQTIRHMTSKTNIQDSRTNTMILHNIHHLRHKRPRLPGKSRTRLKNNPEIRMTPLKRLQHLHQMPTIIILASHKMPPTKIHPLQIWHPSTKLLLNMPEHTLKLIRIRLTQSMTMKTSHTLRQTLLHQFITKNTKPRTRSTRIIQLRLNLRILRIHTQTTLSTQP